MANAAPISDSITAKLRAPMESQGFTSFRSLAQAAGISEGQVLQFRRGNAPKMRLEMLQKLAGALQIELTELLNLAGIGSPQVGIADTSAPSSSGENPKAEEALKAEALKTEYARLQQQLSQQEAELRQRFQQESLYLLEAWMKNWPRVVHAVQTDKPDLAAAKILPLIKPLDQLLQSWNVESIGSIGQTLSYNPQEHQLLKGQAQAEDPVTVSRPGYRQGDRLLHRAEVTGS